MTRPKKHAKPNVTLPDLRRMYRHAKVPPDDECLKRLAVRHQFPNPDEAARTLYYLWDWSTGSHLLGPFPTATEKKRYLAELARRTEALIEAIRCAGVEGTSALYAATHRDWLDLEVLQRQLPRLLGAAQVASRSVARTKPGGTRTHVRDNLISKLWETWRRAKGHAAPRISNNNGTWGGPFFDFVVDAFEALGEPPPPDTTLGRAIVKMIKLTDAAERSGRIRAWSSELESH